MEPALQDKLKEIREDIEKEDQSQSPGFSRTNRDFGKTKNDFGKTKSDTTTGDIPPQYPNKNQNPPNVNKLINMVGQAGSGDDSSDSDTDNDVLAFNLVVDHGKDIVVRANF